VALNHATSLNSRRVVAKLREMVDSRLADATKILTLERTAKAAAAV
jgi:hypothetical protein